MKHFHDITVAVANTATNPVVYTFKVDKGLITWAGVFFPPGCHGVVHVKIFFQAHQILPRNQEAWVRGNAGWWDGELYFPVTAAPMVIKVIAYSHDDINDCDAGFPHLIIIGLELTPWNMIPPWERLLLIWERVAKIFGVTLPPTPITEFAVEKPTPEAGSS